MTSSRDNRRATTPELRIDPAELLPIDDSSYVGSPPAGALVPPRMKIPPRSLVRGSPAKVVREVNDEEAKMGPTGALHYVENARRYRAALGA